MKSAKQSRCFPHSHLRPPLLKCEPGNVTTEARPMQNGTQKTLPAGSSLAQNVSNKVSHFFPRSPIPLTFQMEQCDATSQPICRSLLYSARGFSWSKCTSSIPREQPNGWVVLKPGSICSWQPASGSASIYDDNGRLVERKPEEKKQGQAMAFQIKDVDAYRPTVRHRPRGSKKKLPRLHEQRIQIA